MLRLLPVNYPRVQVRAEVRLSRGAGGRPRARVRVRILPVLFFFFFWDCWSFLSTYLRLKVINFTAITLTRDKRGGCFGDITAVLHVDSLKRLFLFWISNCGYFTLEKSLFGCTYIFPAMSLFFNASVLFDSLCYCCDIISHLIPLLTHLLPQ